MCNRINSAPAVQPVTDPATTGHDGPCCPHCACPVQTRYDYRERVEEAHCGNCGWACEVAEPCGRWQEEEPPVLRCECAWCGKLIREGALPVSHDICESCYERIMAESLAAV